MLLAALVQLFGFQFEGVTSKDSEYESDQFIIGTTGNGILNAVVTSVGNSISCNQYTG